GRTVGRFPYRVIRGVDDAIEVVVARLQEMNTGRAAAVEARLPVAARTVVAERIDDLKRRSIPIRTRGPRRILLVSDIGNRVATGIGDREALATVAEISVVLPGNGDVRPVPSGERLQVIDHHNARAGRETRDSPRAEVKLHATT